MAKTPEQAIFDSIWGICTDLVGSSHVFDFRPMTETAYPFIDIQSTESSFLAVKGSVPIPTVSITVNIWDRIDNRKSTNEKAYSLLDRARRADSAYGHSCSLRENSSGIQTLIDDTVTPNLIRAMVTLTFEV